MIPNRQSERDVINFQMLEALKDGLQGLDDLKLVPHNEPSILRLKQHLRAKIRELERQLDARYFQKAA